MKKLEIGTSGVNASAVSLGCMRIGALAESDLDKLIGTSLDAGITFFDHADIYGGGRCEEVFGASIRRLGVPRDSIQIQSKCGIRKGFFDFSKEHIVTSVEGILSRLQTESIDFLLLHRPDALMEPEEVWKAFRDLKEQGKVLHFGVSNFNPAQIELLQSGVSVPLHANQLQFGLMHSGMIDHGVTVNMKHENSATRDGSILEFCRLRKITVQPWSPFQYGFFDGVFIDNPEFEDLNKTMDVIAERYGITKTGLAIAWILRHPARMQPVLGTTKPERVKEVAAGSAIEISREDWYELYRSTGNIIP